MHMQTQTNPYRRIKLALNLDPKFITMSDVRHRRRRPGSIIEQHYRVDPTTSQVLPGLPVHDPDFKRDIHDFFNLIVLVPIVVLNSLNWNWDTLFETVFFNSNKRFQDAWEGDWFEYFFWTTLAYFAVDLIWVWWIPTCVKSPGTIIKHHVATLLYIIIPYQDASLQWCMGACMSVEINTWFLIARRILNKQGYTPWILQLPGSPWLSIRVKFLSIAFYVTWVSIRCILYPYMWYSFGQNYLQRCQELGSPLNVWAIVLPIHSIFCLLNLKWSYDLLQSKLKYWKKLADARREGHYGSFTEETSKGL